MLLGPLHLLRSCSMVSEGSFLLICRNRFASTMLGEAVIGTTFGEAIIVVRPPGKHDELLVCKRLSEGSLAPVRGGVD